MWFMNWTIYYTFKIKYNIPYTYLYTSFLLSIINQWVILTELTRTSNARALHNAWNHRACLYQYSESLYNNIIMRPVTYYKLCPCPEQLGCLEVLPG